MYVVRKIFIFLILICGIILVSCSSNIDNPILSIEIDETTVNNPYTIDTFAIETIYLIIHRKTSDESIPIAQHMISNNQLTLLDTTGTHTITVRYLTFETTLTITLTEMTTIIETDSERYAIYLLALENDDEIGTYEDWLQAIQGKSAYEIFKKYNPESTKNELEWLNSLNGESAYEIYKKYYPQYTKSESEWIEDLIHGRLIPQETVTLYFHIESYTQTMIVTKGIPVDNLPTPNQLSLNSICEGNTGYWNGWYAGQDPNASHFGNLTIPIKDTHLYTRVICQATSIIPPQDGE
jgi:hypothetical protein